MGEKSRSYIQAHDMQETLSQFESLYYEAIGKMRAGLPE
jgi:hypothetical protein